MFYFNCAFYIFGLRVSSFCFFFNLEIIDVTLCVAWYFVKKICFFFKHACVFFFFWCLMIIMMMMIMMTVPTIHIGERKRLTCFIVYKSKPLSHSHKQSSFHFPLHFLFVTNKNADFSVPHHHHQTNNNYFSSSQTYFFD